jgi:hypothetical protein
MNVFITFMVLGRGFKSNGTRAVFSAWDGIGKASNPLHITVDKPLHLKAMYKHNFKTEKERGRGLAGHTGAGIKPGGRHDKIYDAHPSVGCCDCGYNVRPPFGFPRCGLVWSGQTPSLLSPFML